MGMERIKYSNPKEVMEAGELPKHHFDIVIDGEKVGGAEVDYFSKPIPLYQVSELYVDFEHKGRGYASEIMTQVESWLSSRKKPGILADGIMEGDVAKGMYERRGWIEVPESHGIYVFNWPKGIDFSVLKGYGSRYTDMMQRESFKNQEDS